MKIFKCLQCGNIVLKLKDNNGILNCCGKEMLELKANIVDAAVEKHVPVIKKEENNVTLTCGEVLHPMEEAHYIEFMILETNKNSYIHYLKPGDDPVSSFVLNNDEEVVAAYAYCNLHGLWKSE